jgi:acylphosphatase
MKKAKLFTIIGRVQGVGFRYFTNHLANKIGIYGYVKNLYNGNVEVYAIGTDDQLEILKTNLQRGPSYSYVERVLEEDMPVEKGYLSFDIRF